MDLRNFQPSRTLPGLLIDRAGTEPARVALRHRSGTTTTTIDWATYRARVSELALGLAEQGVRRGDRVAVMSSARPEWTFMALAVQSVGGVVVGVYPTNSPAEIEALLLHSEAVAFVGETTTELDKLATVAGRTPQLRLVVGIDDAPSGLPETVRGLTWDELRVDDEPVFYAAMVAGGDLDDPAVLFYTSGSTGRPKGVTHSHRTVQHSIQTVVGCYPELDRTEHETVGFLPLAHVAPAVLLLFTPLLTRLVVTFCRMEEFAETLREVRPTALLWPPRFYEKLAGELVAQAEGWPAERRRAYALAMEVARELAEQRWERREPSPELQSAYDAALRDVFLPLRASVGMDRIEVAWTASAAIPANVMALWQMWGVDLREMYGLTETAGCPIAQFEQPFPRPGDIGRVFGRVFDDPRFDVRAAEDGEMLIKAPLLFPEYWRDPEATAEALDDGWLRTGDLIEQTATGNIRLVGRKKDIIITSGGKTISPQPLETALKESPLIGEAVVIGDGRKYLTVLLEPSADAADDEPTLRSRLRAEVERVNADLARAQQLKDFRLLPRALDVANGERTANGKVKRDGVVRSFVDLIDEMYPPDDTAAIASAVRSHAN